MSVNELELEHVQDDTHNRGHSPPRATPGVGGGVLAVHAQGVVMHAELARVEEGVRPDLCLSLERLAPL